ncbi:spore germination protein [Paenibacillus elgii]|uniref:spore germination protein n=1 Tax=Paenibacillus elgii TaxID=189691 RepID=UPI00203ABD3F|nr:spore germination protein [Paenibacillus elgii]MCM3269936.1 spore germination protein [Paenibacillus elgii]
MPLFSRIRNRSPKLPGRTSDSPSHEAPQESPEPPRPPDGCADLDIRLHWFQAQLDNCSDAVFHSFSAGPDQRCALIYIRGMVEQKTLEENVLNVLLSMQADDAAAFRRDIFKRKRLPMPNPTVTLSLPEGLTALLDGHALLLMQDEPLLLDFAATYFEKRAIEEAPNEALIRGPREAFIENLEVNLTLIRRRLKTPALKIETLKVGARTQTDVALLFLQDVCKPELIAEVRQRLAQIKIDGVLGSSYLEEQIEDNPYSPFPQMQYTERPDVVTAALLEGRVALIMDGTPIVVLAPVSLFMLMQSAEDYYQRYIASTWIRWIRFLFLCVSMLLPSTYVAVTTFHPEIIPSRLLITVASSREVVPFPALVEAFMMEIAFEALREAAVRIPKSIGQAVSIIGALIIGTAAVQAGIVSAAMVIIVALTGIASFIIPHYDLGLAIRLLRFPIMILAGMFGLFGIACGLLLVYLHLLSLRSFGFPYLAPLAPFVPSDLKDTVVRTSWRMMKLRPWLISAGRPSERMNARSRKPEQEGGND